MPDEYGDDPIIEAAPSRGGEYSDPIVERPDPVYQSAALKFAKDDALSGAQAGPEALPLPARLKTLFPEYAPKPEHEALYQEEYTKWQARKPEYDLAKELGRSVAETPGQDLVAIPGRGYVSVLDAVRKMSPDMRRTFADTASKTAQPKERGYIEKMLDSFGRGMEATAEGFGTFGRNILVPQGDPKAESALRAAKGAARETDKLESDAAAGLANAPIQAAGFAADVMASIGTSIVGGPAGTLAYWTARTAGSRLGEFEDAGFSSEAAKPMALVSGLIEGAIENIEQPLKMLPGFGPAKEAAKKTLGAKLKKIVMERGISALKETGEEVLQDLAADTIQEFASHMAENAPDVDWTGKLKKNVSENIKAFPAMALMQAPGATAEAAGAVEGKVAADKKERAVTEQALEWGRQNPEALQSLLESETPGSRSSSNKHKVPWATESRAVREQAIGVLREQAQMRASEVTGEAPVEEAAPEPAQPEIAPPAPQEQAPAPVQEEAQATPTQEAPPVVTEQEQVQSTERRGDSPLRERVNALAPENRADLVREIANMPEADRAARIDDLLQRVYEGEVDPVTNLPSRRVFQSLEKEGKLKPFKMAMDVIGLGGANDKVDYAFGDALLQTVAATNKDALLDTARWGGDELMSHGDSAEALKERGDKLNHFLANKTIEFTDSSGKVRKIKGARVVFGIGQTTTEAAGLMETAKEKARETGVRPAKGELPGFMVEEDEGGRVGPVKRRDSSEGRVGESAPPPEGRIGGTEPIRPGDQQAQVKRKGFEAKPTIQAREEAPAPKRKGFRKRENIQAAEDQAKKPAPVPRPPDSDTTLEEGVAGETKNPQQIIADASRRFGVPIAKKFTHAAKNMGIYDRYQKIVRLAGPHSANLYVMSHEVAHHIDEEHKITQSMPSAIRAAAGQLDYDPNAQRPSEGFAEFIAKKLDGREMKGAAAKVNSWFDRYLAGNPELRAKLNETRADVKGWQEVDASTREKGTRTTEEFYKTKSLGERITQKRQEAQRALTDDIAVFTDVTEDVQAARRKAGLPELEEGDRFDKAARAIRGIANAWANRSFDEGVFNPETNEKLPGVRGLKQIVSEMSSEQLESVIQFGRARHSLDVWATGRNPGLSRKDARVLFDKYKEDKKIVGWADELVRYRKAMVDVAEQLGMITKEDAAAIRKSWPNTFSLKRAKDERLKGAEGAGGVGLFKRMSQRGSGEPVLDPLAVLVKETNVFYAQAEKHLKDRIMLENIRGVPGMGKWMAKVQPGQEPKRVTFSEIKQQIEAAGGDVSDIDPAEVFTFFRGAKGKESDMILPYLDKQGNAEWWQFTPQGMELYHTLKGQEKESMALAMKVMNAASRLKRAGAVSWRLGFSTLSNPFRDLITGALQTKGKAISQVLGTLYNYAAAGPQLLHRAAGGDMNAADKLYKNQGLESAHFMGPDIATYKANIERATNDPVQKKLYRIATTPAEAKHYLGKSVTALPATVEAIGNIVESAPRRAEFNQILEKTGVTRQEIESGKPIALRRLIPAMLAAKEVTTNFQQGGSWTKKYSLVHAFANAQVQGYVQPAQRFKEHKLRFALRGFLGLTMPTLAYWMLRRDDEERKEMPGWLKYGFWHIPGEDGKVFRVPRPFELGTFFSGAPEAMMDAIYEKDPKEADRFLESFAPNKGSLLRMMPDAVQPAIEGLLNYDAFRDKQIVGRDREKMEAKDQFYEYNTAFSKYLGIKLDMSPAKIDHVIGQYTGGLGVDILKTPEEGPAKALALGRIEARTERGASINDFYATKDAIERAYNSGGKMDKAPRQVIAEKHRLDAIDDLMAKTRDYIQTLPGKDERYKAQRWITALARAGMGREELSAYPNPLKSDSLPTALQAEVDKWLITRADNIAKPKPMKSKDLAKAQREWSILRDDNLKMLNDMGVDMDRIYKIFLKSDRSTKDDVIRFKRLVK